MNVCRGARFGRSLAVGVAAALMLGATGCGGDDGATDPASEITTSAPASDITTGAPAQDTTLRVLVTNDDGIAAEGLDVMVEALRALPGVEVTVIAPADNKSGTGGSTTPGEVAVTDAATASGFPGKAVAGFPADTVVYALDKGGLAERPHVVLSGINQGANVGPLVDISGTVGAARAAAARGVPALAASQGAGTDPDYEVGVSFVLQWLTQHRDELLAGTMAAEVESLNIPTCATGAIRGQVEVPTGTNGDGKDLVNSNCESTAQDPADDIDAFANGFVSLSPVPLAAGA